MLSGEDNENGEQTTMGLISKKATLHVQKTFFVHFFCHCFARPQRETSRNFLVTRFMEEMSYVFLFTFLFFTASHFHLHTRSHFSFSHRCYKIFILFFHKKSLLCFLSLALAPRSRFSHTDRPSSVNKTFIIWPNKKAKEQKHQFQLHLCL